MISVSPFVNHIVIAAFAGLLAWAAVEDIRTFKIPNRISLAIIGLYPAHVLAAPGGVNWVGGLSVGFAVLAAGFVLFALRWVGAGDVKLVAATSIWAGPTLIVPFLMLTGVAGGILSVAILVRDRLALRAAAQSASGAAGETGAEGDKPPISKSLRTNIPYGVAITAGGLYVAARLFAL